MTHKVTRQKYNEESKKIERIEIIRENEMKEAKAVVMIYWASY